MIPASLAHVRDKLHAQFCYQIFITPIHFPIEKEFRDRARMACEFIEKNRSEIIHQDSPRHHVLHRFIPLKNANGKKILITHGWMSRAAYMMRLINVLHQQGYEVYALDFPAHGEAKGIQLPWIDAVTILKETINKHGPFYGVIGHSFGGSMLLNTLNISGQLADWTLNSPPEKAVLIASPTEMISPIKHVAKKLKLTFHGYLKLRHLMQEQAKMSLSLIRLHNFVVQDPTTSFLCIHGEFDTTVSPNESISFCKKYQNADLQILSNADHVSVLMDERVERAVCDFLE